jgi:hypothetical protein
VALLMATAWLLLIAASWRFWRVVAEPVGRLMPRGGSDPRLLETLIVANT